MADHRPRIVIVGSGFGGIKTARLLAKQHLAADLLLIDKHNYHLFQPLLYQVSTAILSVDEIAYPVRAFFRKNKNVEFLMAQVVGFDEKNKCVVTNHGTIAYDYLVLAAGATTNFFGMESVKKYSFGMKTLAEASHIRNHVLHMFERANRVTDPAERRRLLTFICVGGGPTGVEEAGSLAELIYVVMAQEYHHLDFSQVSIKLIEATDKLLPMMPENLRDETARVLHKKKVEVMLNTQVLDCDDKCLTLKDGRVIPTATVIWAAGVKAVPVIAKLDAAVDRAGRVIVEKTLQVPNYPEIFAIGDNAHFLQDGQPLATIASVATRQAVICAENIGRLIKGNTQLAEFRYKDPGSMATIGRGEAVMFKGKFQMKGFFAWCAWMLVHLMLLAGAHTNITVALKWIWNLVSGIRLGRIITNVKADEE